MAAVLQITVTRFKGGTYSVVATDADGAKEVSRGFVDEGHAWVEIGCLLRRFEASQNCSSPATTENR